jgi:hypothetical protein
VRITNTIGNFSVDFSGRRKVFSFEGVAKLLLSNTAAGSHRFPFDREMALAVLLSWALWEDNSQHRDAARLAAGAITFQSRTSDGTFEQKKYIKDCQSLVDRFGKSWYREFYNLFFEPIGGLHSLLRMYPPHEFDSEADDRQGALNSALDMIEFLLMACRDFPQIATRNNGMQFVANNGFGRPAEFYGVRIGQSRAADKTRNYFISKDAVSTHWGHASDSLGFAYVLRRAWPELWFLSFADHDFVNKLCGLANDHQKISALYECYHWLLDVAERQLTEISKFDKFPMLEDFSPRKSIDVPSFTAEQLELLYSIVPKAKRKLIKAPGFAEERPPPASCKT